MDTVLTIKDYKDILKTNRDKVLSNAVNASDISEKDEWMQEDLWDEIYSS